MTTATLPTVGNGTLSPITISGHTATPVPGTQVFVRDPLAFDKLTAPWQSEHCTNAGPTNAGDTTVYTGKGGEKNGDAFNTMTWGAGSIPNNKDDLSNVYTVAYRDDAGDLVIYFALERVAHNGSSHLDVEFLHSAVTRTRTGSDSNGCPNGSFQGDRTTGDLIVGINFDNGGGLGAPIVFQYDSVQGQYVQSTSLPTGAVAVTTNTGTIDCGSWGCRTTNATILSRTTMGQAEFVEGYVDTGLLNQPVTGCLNTYFAHSRSSDPITSTLKDFAEGNFNTCTLTLNTAPSSTTVVAGAGVTDTATLTAGGTLGGSQPVPNGKVQFGICGPSVSSCASTDATFVALGDPVSLTPRLTAAAEHVYRAIAIVRHDRTVRDVLFQRNVLPGTSDSYGTVQDGSAAECFSIVNGTVSVTPTATNAVGTAHVFTSARPLRLVHAEQDRDHPDDQRSRRRSRPTLRPIRRRPTARPRAARSP